TKNKTKPVIRNVMIALITLPNANVTPFVGDQSRIESAPSKSEVPVIIATNQPISGVIKPCTTWFTMLVNALPITTPTARSKTSPRMMNSLNSLIMNDPPFFYLSLVYRKIKNKKTIYAFSRLFLLIKNIYAIL
ncbi:hypothetical protein A5845_002375, partial [Enterococcus faecium]